MTALRNLNSAVQSAEFPSHEFAQAVREWIAEATERMEPASDGAKVECVICQQPGYCDHDCPEMPEPTAPEYVATPMLGFPCENCGQQTLRKDGHVSHRASGDETEYYCDKPAQPEPAASVAMPDSGAPDGTPYEIAEAVAKLSRHGEKQEAHNLAGWWMRLRTHAAQPQVAMSPDLEDLLDSIMSFADVDPDTQVKQIWRRKVAAVRAQAAGVKLPKVRGLLSKLQYGHSISAQYKKEIAASLAELDAAEGKAETKEGK